MRSLIHFLRFLAAQAMMRESLRWGRLKRRPISVCEGSLLKNRYITLRCRSERTSKPCCSRMRYSTGSENALYRRLFIAATFGSLSPSALWPGSSGADRLVFRNSRSPRRRPSG